MLSICTIERILPSTLRVVWKVWPSKIRGGMTLIIDSNASDLLASLVGEVSDCDTFHVHPAVVCFI